MIITEKSEIEKLANGGYAASLIAYGADLYRRGMNRGIKLAVAGFGLGYLVSCVRRYRKNKEEEL